MGDFKARRDLLLGRAVLQQVGREGLLPALGGRVPDFAQPCQQRGDLLVDRLGLRNGQYLGIAHRLVCDGARPAHVIPGSGLDGGNDQVHERLEVGIDVAVLVAIHFHEVGHLVDPRRQLALGRFGGGNEQRAVLDQVGHAQLAERQPQGRPQGDVLEVLGHRHVGAEAPFVHRLLVQLDVDVVFLFQEVDHVRKRRVDEFELRRRVEGVNDLLFRRSVLGQFRRTPHWPPAGRENSDDPAGCPGATAFGPEGPAGLAAARRPALPRRSRPRRRTAARRRRTCKGAGDGHGRRRRLDQVLGRQGAAGPGGFIAAGQADLPLQVGQGHFRGLGVAVGAEQEPHGGHAQRAAHPERPERRHTSSITAIDICRRQSCRI